MGKKVFVSYKHSDTNVSWLPFTNGNTTVRDYVTEVERVMGYTGNIYKGEHDNEDLSYLSEETIWEKLKDKIFDSSITLVMISPGMKEPYRSEQSQWIPWEISYSLRETTRNGRVSCTNAVLAVVLPDRFGQYDYYLSECRMCPTRCRVHNRSFLFRILSNNMFNKKHLEDDRIRCHDGQMAYGGNPSYIDCVKWEDFIRNPNYYLEVAENIKNNAYNYNITKELR